MKIPFTRSLVLDAGASLRKPSVLAGLLLVGVQIASADVIPYSNDFSGTGSNTAFPNQTTASDWSVTGGTYVNSTSSTSLPVMSSSLSLTNMGTVAFTLTSQVTVTSFGSPNGNGLTLGFGLFGLSSNFSGSNAASAYYLADWAVATTGAGSGSVRVIALGDTTGVTTTTGLADDNSSSSILAATLGTTYTLKVDGVYSGSTLNLTLGIYDAAGTTQIGTSATLADTSPLAGTFFGYRDRVGIAGGTFTAAYDNFGVSAVPEPSSFALLAFSSGLTALALRRRFRKA